MASPRLPMSSRTAINLLPTLFSQTEIPRTHSKVFRHSDQGNEPVEQDDLLRHDAQRVIRLGRVEVAAGGSEVLQPQFVYETRPHLREFECHPASAGRHGDTHHLLRAAIAVGTAVGRRCFPAIGLNRVAIRAFAEFRINWPEEIDDEAIVRRPHFGDAARKLIGMDLHADNFADVVAGPPTTIADAADVQLAARRHAANQRTQEAALRIVRRNAQRIRRTLEGVADTLERHADQPARVVFAADQVSFERTKEIVTEFRTQLLGRVKEADAVDAARPRVRDVDGGRRAWRRGLAAFQEIDEAEMGTLPDMIQFVERFVVALIVGDEQFAGAIERQTHREAVAGGDRSQGEPARLGGGRFARRQTQDVAMKARCRKRTLVLLAGDAEEVFAALVLW